jgi:6,7-dimethyl-8-ribityllumazine synthase
MNTFQGNFEAKNLRIGIVAGRYNDLITQKLIQGAEDCYLRHGGEADHLDLYWVPGSFEIPPLAMRLAQSKKYDALLCLGAVIRGSTPHFDYVASEVAKGVGMAAMETGIPVIFGVLTTDTLEQALERAGVKSGNKGWDGMMSALEVANLVRHTFADAK